LPEGKYGFPIAIFDCRRVSIGFFSAPGAAIRGDLLEKYKTRMFRGIDVKPIRNGVFQK
jgi:hypothetical protein